MDSLQITIQPESSTKELRSYPVTIGFNPDILVGNTILEFPHNLPLHEYYLLPEYVKHEDGSFEVLSYSLIHRTQVPNPEILELRER